MAHQQPTLSTGRLTLRPFTMDDAADVFAYASNPNVPRYMPWPTHTSLNDATAYLNRVLARHPGDYCWAIIVRPSTRVVGAIELGPGDGSALEAHYVLAEPLWGKGIMTEALDAVLRWGFQNFPDVTMVRSMAMRENVGSWRVMEKCGMRLRETRAVRWAKFDAPVEEVVYSITRGEWAARSA